MTGLGRHVMESAVAAVTTTAKGQSCRELKSADPKIAAKACGSSPLQRTALVLQKEFPENTRSSHPGGCRNDSG
jgi:hypothetical protein